MSCFSNGILKGKGELASMSPRYDGNVETGTRPSTERSDEDREDEPFTEDFCEFIFTRLGNCWVRMSLILIC